MIKLFERSSGRMFCLLSFFALAACGGGGGGGDGTGGGSAASEPADRFVVSGNRDGTLSILRVDPVAGFANASAYLKVSGFRFQDMIHDAANGRLVTLTREELQVLAFDSTTGEIAEIDERSTSGGSSHLALKDDGSVAYVASRGPDSNERSIDVYTIASGGTLGSPVSTSLAIQPDYVTLNPANDRLYALSRRDDQIAVFDVNADGSLAATPATFETDENPTALVFNAAGTVAYVTQADASQNLGIYDVNGNGELNLRTSFDVDRSPIDLVLSADGANLYVLEVFNDELHHFSVEVATGELTFVDSTNLSFTPTDLTLSPTGTELYVSHSEGDFVSTLAVNASDGTLTEPNFARVFNGANTVAAIGGRGALIPTATFLLVPDRTGLSVFEVGNDGLLNLRDKVSTEEALIDGEVEVQGAAELLLGAGRKSGNRDLLNSYEFDFVRGDLNLIESVDPTFNTLPVAGFQRIELGGSGRFFYVLDQNFTNERAFVRTFSYSTAGDLTVTPEFSRSVGEGAENLTLHPAGSYLYSVDSFADRISRLEVNATTGGVSFLELFRPGGDGSGVGRPIDLKFDPSGRYAYVSLFDDSEVVRYVVNEDGSLSSLVRTSPPQNGGVDVEPGAIGMHPSGRYLYVGEGGGSSDSIAIYDIQPKDRLDFRSRIDAAGRPTSIEIDPLGRFLHVRYSDESVQVFSIDAATGDLSDTEQVVDAGDDGGFLPTMTLVAPLRVEG